jgi:hypothetical protein
MRGIEQQVTLVYIGKAQSAMRHLTMEGLVIGLQ